MTILELIALVETVNVAEDNEFDDFDESYLTGYWPMRARYLARILLAQYGHVEPFPAKQTTPTDSTPLWGASTWASMKCARCSDR